MNDIKIEELDEDLKAKVRSAVLDYISQYPEEYEAFKLQLSEYKKSLKNEWGSTGDHALERELYQIPENLDNLITKRVSVDSFHNMTSISYAHWFASEFPQFRVSLDV